MAKREAPSNFFLISGRRHGTCIIRDFLHSVKSVGLRRRVSGLGGFLPLYLASTRCSSAHPGDMSAGCLPLEI